ncbi:MAG: hypothetical protein WCI79_01920 [Candidatus Saccharibacteria bacterium]
MEPKKELDEKTYQSNKKKLNKIALGILITAVVVGLGLIIVPRIVTTTPAPVVVSDSELDAQIATIRSGYTKKMGESGWFEEQRTMNEKISKAQKAQSDAEFEAAKVKNSNTSVTVTTTVFGVFIAIAGAIIAGSLLYLANIRKVAGYAAQSIMPVAKEVVTGMAPTMGAATGVAASAAAPGIGDIAREIKKGMNEADEASKK